METARNLDGDGELIQQGGPAREKPRGKPEPARGIKPHRTDAGTWRGVSGRESRRPKPIDDESGFAGGPARSGAGAGKVGLRSRRCRLPGRLPGPQSCTCQLLQVKWPAVGDGRVHVVCLAPSVCTMPWYRQSGFSNSVNNGSRIESGARKKNLERRKLYPRRNAEQARALRVEAGRERTQRAWAWAWAQVCVAPALSVAGDRPRSFCRAD